jgi:hypothetical protein
MTGNGDTGRAAAGGRAAAAKEVNMQRCERTNTVAMCIAA